LFAARFPIEEMRVTSPAELDAPPTGDGNNTSAFVCRPVRGQDNRSAHAYGLAIDLNPFCNPYTKDDLVLPELASVVPGCRSVSNDETGEGTSMATYSLGDDEPDIAPDAFVHPEAVVIGNVRIGPQASVWPCAVLRGDHGRIQVGARTSIQDGTVLHTIPEWPTEIGDECVVGHNVHLEGCTVEPHCLIGSGSVVLNHAVVRRDSVVGAAALVPEGFEVPSGSLAVGVPARIRPLRMDLGWIEYAVRTYLDVSERHRTQLRRLD
jgi:carbonic anhydrase/acetyltransferase-like protein (isoleucine patch superfamily)